MQLRPLALKWIIIVACMGGFLFGYNTAVIAGALPFLKQDLALNIYSEGFIVSCVLMGALAGALFAGKLADRFGRRPLTFVTAGLFLLGIGIVCIATTINVFVWGRLITGAAVGLTSVIAPLYLAEIAPSNKRGAIVGLNQLFITIGVFCAYLVNYFLAEYGAWRIMFFLGAIPALIQLAAFFHLPETAAWNPNSEQTFHWHALFKPKYRKVLCIGLFLSIMQQATGINAIVYYAPEIFKNAGFSSLNGSLFATLGLGLVNMLVTVGCIGLLDRFGRKKLLLIGIAGMIVSLLAISYAFFSHSNSIALTSILSLMGFMAFFAIGLGPITWVVLSELYPLEIRGLAMSLATFANWLFNTVVALTFLDMVVNWGSASAFSLYALIGVVGLFVLLLYLPETKGKKI